MTTLRAGPLDLDVPDNMIDDAKAIFERGEYDVPGVTFDRTPRVLDIGACVGAFAAWSGLRWPGRMLTCVEPNPAALVHLRKNLESLPREEFVTSGGVKFLGHNTVKLIEAAVFGTEPGTTTFYDGVENLGCAGLSPLPEGPPNLSGAGFTVATVPASSLPRADVVKIDTEGQELQILSAYDLSETHLVMLEWHRTADRIAIDNLMRGHGFTLIGGTTRASWLGTMKWLRVPK